MKIMMKEENMENIKQHMDNHVLKAKINIAVSN